jgi:hypothetical protein
VYDPVAPTTIYAEGTVVSSTTLIPGAVNGFAVTSSDYQTGASATLSVTFTSITNITL